MKSKSQLLLFGLALMVSLAGAWFEKTPGYMDAEYYYGNAVRLAQNNGWTEMVLWNYLDSPEGLPHAAHVYWMPLASFLAAASLMIFKTSSFFVARFPFILLSAFIPPLTAEISYSLSQNHRSAVLSGLLAVFSGFYCIYTHNVETFTLYMLLGGLFFLMIQKEPARINRRYVLMMGALAGGMHLSRADGLLWLVAGMGLIFIKSPESGWRKIKSFLTSAIYLFTGYAVIMSPWYLRNLLEWRTFFPEGISQAIWITNYNQLFIYPASRLSFQNWIAAGWSVLLSQRWSALMDNLKTVIGVQSMVILLPLMVWGVWRQKTKTAVRFGLMMEGITLIVMSLIFPLAGARGGFLHSSAAIQPLLWALVPEGLTG
ncbi:MAG: glycosyltransferase family 39 protein, partial [Anaerolineae bacterium]|nr:glycosyltransferase family 39 protein [Anaerolineae bacterium]